MLNAALHDARWLESLPLDLDIYLTGMNESLFDTTEVIGTPSSAHIDTHSLDKVAANFNAICDFEAI
jgi:hypothetical protein